MLLRAPSTLRVPRRGARAEPRPRALFSAHPLAHDVPHVPLLGPGVPRARRVAAPTASGLAIRGRAAYRLLAQCSVHFCLLPRQVPGGGQSTPELPMSRRSRPGRGIVGPRNRPVPSPRHSCHATLRAVRSRGCCEKLVNGSVFNLGPVVPPGPPRTTASCWQHERAPAGLWLADAPCRALAGAGEQWQGPAGGGAAAAAGRQQGSKPGGANPAQRAPRSMVDRLLFSPSPRADSTTAAI
jgi:hypothetical protein